jgi:DNA-directed RNA polymerase subunit RPC12/RpoP
MGSVIDYIDCPNCGHEAYNDFYYKTGEEYVNCQNCGYHYSATYKTDGNGEYVTKDGTDDYSFDNLIMETKELKNPYGAYRLKYYDSVAYQCGSLEDMNDFNQLKEQVMKLDNIEYFSINRFVDGEIVTIDVIDNGPKVDGAGFSEEDRVAE